MTHSLPRPVVLVATEDWFVVSHFLPLIEALNALRCRVVLLARFSDKRPLLEALGVECHPYDVQRQDMGWRALLQETRQLTNLFEALRPAAVHTLALRAALTGGWAAQSSQAPVCVHHITGLGHVGVAKGWLAVGRRFFVSQFLRLRWRQGAHFLFENRSDPSFLGLHATAHRLHFVDGAGVDVGLYPPTPVPPLRPSDPLRLAYVGRLVRSKGVDVLVEAFVRLRARGLRLQLHLFGAVDAKNPDAYTPDELASWSEQGVCVEGPTRTVAKVWREHHLGLFPSRGGEGLPKALLECAAAGRAAITTTTAGCTEVVAQGVNGWLVPPDDVDALMNTLLSVEQQAREDLTLLSRFGEAARTRILDRFTTAHVEARYRQLYHTLLSG